MPAACSAIGTRRLGVVDAVSQFNAQPHSDHLDNRVPSSQYCADSREASELDAIPDRTRRQRHMTGTSATATRSLLFMGLLIGAMTLPACDMGLQGELDQKKQERFEAAELALNTIVGLRTTQLEEGVKAAFPETLEKGRHPLYAWRAGVGDPRTVPAALRPLLKRPNWGAATAESAEGEESGEAADGTTALDSALLEGISKHYRGTPTEGAALKGYAFVRAQAEYWGQRRAGKRANHGRYVKFLEGYIAAEPQDKMLADQMCQVNEAEGRSCDPYVARPFLDEAKFDLAFMHGARIFEFPKYSQFQKITSAKQYWELAYNFSGRRGEDFGSFITRLCRVKQVKDFCKGVPHEYRPIAINRPYTEWLNKRVADYQATNPPGVFGEVNAKLVELLKAELTEKPEFGENPVLPASYAGRAASVGMTLSVSNSSGVVFRTGVTGDDVEIASSFSGKVPGSLAGAVKTKITELENRPGNTVDISRLVLEAPGNVSGSQVVRMIDAFDREKVTQVDMVGRRRVDESLRKTGVLLRRPAPDSSGTMSYRLTQDGAKTKCRYMGVTGKPPSGWRSPGSYLIVDKLGATAIKLSRDEAGDLIVGDVTLRTGPGEKGKLDAWADENAGIVRLFASSAFSYTQILELVSGLLEKCQDFEILMDDRTGATETIVCGKSEARDLTLVLGICD
jgi:hypothetical protein